MADEGASPKELLMEAARRDNEELLNDLLADLKAEDAIATLINTARDGMSYTALHNAAKYGAYNVLDILLDQPMVETDPLVPATLASPLHLAVDYANSLPAAEKANGLAVVEILLDAGCDPRLKNKEGRRPVELADPRDEAVRTALRKGEMSLQAGLGRDVVVENGEEAAGEDSASDEE